MRFSLLLLLSAASVLSCSAADDDEISTGDAEQEGEVADRDDEVVSGGVSCIERVETAYDNGSPRPIRVITVGGKRVSKPTGHAFLKMQAAAKAAGVQVSLTSGFRTQAEQQYLYGCYRSGRCNNGNLAASPGYSNHQNGLALDLSTSSWLAANAQRFGFVRTVPSEPWHYEYRAGKDPGGPCSREAQSSMPWESPKDGGWYQNGIWMKVRPKVQGVAYVKYFAGNYELGESTQAEQGFPARFTFKRLGERTLTAVAYSPKNERLAETSVDITITP